MRSLFSRILSHRIIVVLCRLLLAAVFIYAAVGKVLRPSEFADSVAGFRILPIATVNVFAIVLPWIELVCGLSLITGIFVRSSVVLLAALNVIFIAAAVSAMARGLSIECGCFTLSRAHDTVGWSLIGRAVVFLLLCLPVALHRQTMPKIAGTGGTRRAERV